MNCRFVASDKPRALNGRHGEGCAGEDCAGCAPCRDLHCCICHKTHVERNTCVGCLDATRGDLEAIAALCASLPEEAVDKGVQSEAMMLMSPSSDPEAWRNRATAAMVGRIDASYLEDCRDEMHPLWVMGSWEQIWRDFLDHQTIHPVTWGSAYSYLNTQIGYMADQVEPPFDEFARELRGCRAHLENVLHAGIREERSQTPCVDCETRLVKVFADAEPEDHWVCPKCRRVYTEQEFARAQHFHMEDERADKWVRTAEALAVIDRPEQTLRTWMRNGDVKVDKDAKTDALLVWWPDVRAMNLSSPRRNRTKVPTYSGLHQLIRRTRGSASEFPCADCGEQAQHWSYNHTASVELRSALGSPYATDPAHYSPRCQSCHRRFDSESA